MRLFQRYEEKAVNASVTSFSMTNSGLDDAGLEKFIELFLQHPREIAKFDLSGNELTDKCVDSLLKLNIKALDLSNNNLTEKSIVKLASSHLSKVRLVRNNIKLSQALVKEVAEASGKTSVIFLANNPIADGSSIDDLEMLYMAQGRAMSANK